MELTGEDGGPGGTVIPNFRPGLDYAFTSQTGRGVRIMPGYPAIVVSRIPEDLATYQSLHGLLLSHSPHGVVTGFTR